MNGVASNQTSAGTSVVTPAGGVHEILGGRFWIVSVIAISVFAAAVLAYASVSEALERRHVTAAMVFIVVGAGLGLLLEHRLDPAQVRTLAELTLALVLFHDAAELQPRELRHDVGVCARLLLVGLPLTLLAGFLIARVLFGDLDAWLALLLAAALTPTDASLGASTVLNPVVPVRVRRVLNVESGLNDGLTTPVVLFALAAAGPGGGQSLGTALQEIVVGVAVGIGVGVLTGFGLARADAAALVEHGLVPVATVAVPLLCYYGAVALDGNGFVAAFVAGSAFAAGATGGHLAPDRRPLTLTGDGATLLGYAVWCLFGVILVAHLGDIATLAGAVFAVLSLTVLRMVPVSLVLLGTGFRRPTRLFIGWFGPRGLASVVFALIAVEDYPDNPDVGHVTASIALAVLLSVVLHGASADVGARRYGAWVARTRPSAELGDAVSPVVGRGTRRRWLHAGRRPSATG